MCSKVLNGHIILTDTSITTILAPEMTYTPNFLYLVPLTALIMELNDKKFAVLVDADNISHRKIKDILDEIANYGTPTIKRIYGDFTNPKFAAWKEVLLENSITPIQ